MPFDPSLQPRSRPVPLPLPGQEPESDDDCKHVFRRPSEHDGFRNQLWHTWQSVRIHPMDDLLSRHQNYLNRKYSFGNNHVPFEQNPSKFPFDNRKEFVQCLHLPTDEWESFISSLISDARRPTSPGDGVLKRGKFGSGLSFGQNPDCNEEVSSDEVRVWKLDIFYRVPINDDLKPNLSSALTNYLPTATQSQLQPPAVHSSWYRSARILDGHHLIPRMSPIVEQKGSNRHIKQFLSCSDFFDKFAPKQFRSCSEDFALQGDNSLEAVSWKIAG
jgi:hypothetical protein